MLLPLQAVLEIDHKHFRAHGSVAASRIYPVNFPFFLPPPPNTPTHWCLPTSRRSLWKQKLEASPFGKVGVVCFCFFFLNDELLTLSLSETFHILLTRPFLLQFKPKRHPWPHLNSDSTNSRLCTYSPPTPQKSFHPVWLIKYLLFSEQITFVNLQTSATNPYPCAIYLKSTKANWFLPWQPDPGSQLSSLLQFLVLVLGLDSFDLENKGE